MNEEQSQPRISWEMLFLFFVIMVSFFDTLSQLPIISPYARHLGSTEQMIGLIVSTYSLVNFFANFFAGYFIDRYGRKIVIVLGMTTAGIAIFLYSVVTTPLQFLAVRVLHGLGGGFLVPAAFTSAGDRAASSTNRGGTMAKAGVAVAVAAILGPPFSGIMKDRLGYDYVFYSVAALLLITALLAAIFLKETLGEREEETGPKTSYKDIFNRHTLWISYLAAFFLMFGQGILALSLPLYTENLGISSTMTGVLFSSFAFSAMIIFMIPKNWIGKLLKREWNNILSITIGLFFVLLSLFLIPFFTDLSLLFVSMLIYGIGFGFLFPAMNTLIVESTEKRERGTAFGIFYAFFSLGVVLGPLVVSFFQSIPLSSFHIGSLFVAIGLITVLLIKSRMSITHD